MGLLGPKCGPRLGQKLQKRLFSYKPPNIKLQNCLFVRDVRANLSIPPSQNYFIKSENLHQYNTRQTKQNSVILTQQNIDFYSTKSMQHQAVITWNKLHIETNHDVLQDL